MTTADELVARRPAWRTSAAVLHRFTAPRRGRAFWIALWAAAAAAEFGALAPVIFHHVPVEPIDVVFRVIGGSFAACGLVAWHRRPDSHSGPLMTATGFAFFVSPLLGQLDSPVARTAGLWLPDLWVLFFVALLLTYLTGGRLRTTVDRVLVGAVLVELAVLAPLWLVFAEEDDNLLLAVPNAQVAGVVDAVQRSVFLVVAVGVAAVVAARWRRASRPGRRAMLPSAAGSVCLLLFAALLATDLVVGERSQVLLWIAASSLVAVPAAFLAGLLRSRLARSGLTDLFGRLQAMRPAALQAALAHALGDPDLLITFSLPVDAGDRSVAMIERDGVPVAALVHDRSLDEDPELVEAVVAVAAIALENSHLHTEAEARLAELQASRARIVVAGDAERRRIERNLHDGAQQRLITVALLLSLARRQIRIEPADAEKLVDSAAEELSTSLAELRALARGIHPAVLDQGLEVALDALVVRATVPTTVEVPPGPPLPEPVAFAAYFVASEALANVAKYARATSAAIRVRRTDRHATIEIVDDGVGGADPALGTGLLGLADRVEALGGRLSVSDRPEGGTVVRAELPCPATA
jgi:signal transduction histidine kinase